MIWKKERGLSSLFITVRHVFKVRAHCHSCIQWCFYLFPSDSLALSQQSTKSFCHGDGTAPSVSTRVTCSLTILKDTSPMHTQGATGSSRVMLHSFLHRGNSSSMRKVMLDLSCCLMVSEKWDKYSTCTFTTNNSIPIRMLEKSWKYSAGVAPRDTRAVVYLAM